MAGVSFNLAPMVRLVHRSYQLIGLCPYLLPPDINSNHFGLTTPTAIYSTILAAMSMVALTFHAIEDVRENISRSNLFNVSSRFMLVGGVGFHIFAIIFSIRVRKSMWKFIRDITNIDHKLQSLGVQFNYERQYWVAQVFTILWISFGGTLVFIHCYRNLDAFHSFSTFIGQIFSHFAAVGNFGALMSQFFFCLLLIYTRYMYLNGAFKRRLLQDDAPKNVDAIVTRFRIIHDEITDTVRNVNSLLSLLAMSGVSVTIVLTVVTLSAYYKELTSTSDDIDIALNPTHYIYYFIFMTFINVIMASILTSEGKSTAILVHKAVNRDILASNIRHLRLFSQQLRTHPPLVTCWLYNYDWELLYTILSTISIYAVIFIQFDIMAAEHKRNKLTQ